jgi:hypothetical protein
MIRVIVATVVVKIRVDRLGIQLHYNISMAPRLIKLYQRPYFIDQSNN